MVPGFAAKSFDGILEMARQALREVDAQEASGASA